MQVVATGARISCLGSSFQEHAREQAHGVGMRALVVCVHHRVLGSSTAPTFSAAAPRDNQHQMCMCVMRAEGKPSPDNSYCCGGNSLVIV